MRLLSFLYLAICVVCGRSNDDGSYSFLAIGDWGGQPDQPYKTPQEISVAKQMENVAANSKVKFIMALGDNFYEDGVTDEYDPRFAETYEQVYNAESLNVPWYVIAGNHDHHQNVSAQIAYTKRSSRWIYPDYFYSKTIKSAGVQLDLVMIDTVILCGDSGNDDAGMQPQGPRSSAKANEHWSWIDETLSTSTADYLLVAGHYPVWSVGHHGPTDCLVERLRPLLQKYNVTAYLCGHDHNLQYLKERHSSVNYILTGAADKVTTERTHKDDVPKHSEKFFWAPEDHSGGLVVCNVNSSSISVNFVSGHGKTLYKCSMKPRTLANS